MKGADVSTYNEAVYQVVHRSDIPPKQLAAILGVGESTLYNCANPNMDEPALSRKHIIPLTLATRNFAILDHFEQACGRVAFEIPPADGGLSKVAGEVAAVTCEFGQLLEQVAAALRDDGRVTGPELRKIEREAADLHRALARLMAVAAREAGR